MRVMRVMRVLCVCYVLYNVRQKNCLQVRQLNVNTSNSPAIRTRPQPTNLQPQNLTTRFSRSPQPPPPPMFQVNIVVFNWFEVECIEVQFLFGILYNLICVCVCSKLCQVLGRETVAYLSFSHARLDHQAYMEE